MVLKGDNKMARKIIIVIILVIVIFFSFTYLGNETGRRLSVYLAEHPKLEFDNNNVDRIHYSKLITSFMKTGSEKKYKELYRFCEDNHTLNENLIYDIIAANSYNIEFGYSVSSGGLHWIIYPCREKGVTKSQYHFLDSLAGDFEKRRIQKFGDYEN